MSECTKTCSKCNTEKNIKDFHKGQGYCKQCIKQYHVENHRKKFKEVFDIISNMKLEGDL